MLETRQSNWPRIRRHTIFLGKPSWCPKQIIEIASIAVTSGGCGRPIWLLAAPVCSKVLATQRKLGSGKLYRICWQTIFVSEIRQAVDTVRICLVSRTFLTPSGAAFSCRAGGCRFDHGVVVVATSNLTPDRLYEHGLQRELFLPFVVLLKEKLDVIELDNGRDWRLARLVGKRVYHHPLGPAAHAALAAAFAELTDGTPGASMTIPVKGRSLVVPHAAGRVAWFG